MNGATPDRLWIGLDLGTSSLKGVALDTDGRAVAEARESYAMAGPSCRETPPLATASPPIAPPHGRGSGAGLSTTP
jgi:hypothetical protein